MKKLLFVALFVLEIPVASAQNNFNNTLVLDGDGDYVEVPDHESLDIMTGDDFTFSAWFKTTSSAQTRLLFKVAPGPYGYAMFVDFGKVWTLTWTPERPAFSVIAPVELSPPPEALYNNDVWHHAAFVRDGNTMSIYVDGDLIQTRSDAVSEPLENGANLGIGARPPDGTGNPPFYFTGSIDEVRIWKVARSQEEIRAHMMEPLDASIYEDPESGLSAYYRFDDLEDLGIGDAGANDVRDFSVSGNHGDMKGGATLDFVGDDDFSEPLLTMQFRGMAPHVGQKFQLRVTDQDGSREVGRKSLDAISSADFDMTLNVLLKNHSYNIDFYADLNGNGAYDPPPTDHAWRVELSPALGGDVVLFEHNFDFIDIDWLPQIKGFNYSDYEAIWKGFGRNDSGGFDFSLLARYVSNREDGTVSGYVEASNVFGYFDLILVYFSGLYSEATQTGEVVPTDNPAGKTRATFSENGSIRQLSLAGKADWSGTLTWEDGGQIAADFEYTPMGLGIDVSVEGTVGKTQGIVNYHSDYFGIDGKMLVEEDSVVSANTSTAIDKLGFLPAHATLLQNYPNPVFPNTSIPFRLVRPADVTIKLYDMLGREVVTLLDASMTSGEHEVSFSGSVLSAGMYVFRMKAKQADGKSVEQSKRLVVLK